MLDRVVWCAVSSVRPVRAVCPLDTGAWGRMVVAGWLRLVADICGRVARGQMDLMEGKEMGTLVLWGRPLVFRYTRTLGAHWPRHWPQRICHPGHEECGTEERGACTVDARRRHGHECARPAQARAEAKRADPLALSSRVYPAPWRPGCRWPGSNAHPMAGPLESGSARLDPCDKCSTWKGKVRGGFRRGQMADPAGSGCPEIHLSPVS